MARVDLVFSLLLLGFAALLGRESWRMPRFEEFDESGLSAPGIVPGMLALALALFAVLLLGQAIARLRAAGEAPPWTGARRVAGCIALLLGYVLLVGRVHFALATAVFVIAFIILFARTRPDYAGRARRWWITALIAGPATAGAVVLVFQELFLVRLP